MKVSWYLELEGQEFTLVSKGLTGTLKPGEKKAARELAMRLAEQRAQQVDTQLQVANGALEHVREAIQQEGADDAKA